MTASLVPALDSLALAIDAAARNDGDIEHHVSALVDGLHATSRAFINALAKFGVVQISPEAGAAFDPSFHEAVSVAPLETVGTRLIRPARVVLASDAGAAGAAADG